MDTSPAYILFQPQLRRLPDATEGRLPTQVAGQQFIIRNCENSRIYIFDWCNTDLSKFRLKKMFAVFFTYLYFKTRKMSYSYYLNIRSVEKVAAVYLFCFVFLQEENKRVRD